LFTFGLITIIYMILGGKNRRIYFISLLVALLFIALSVDRISFFYVLSSLLLVFILTHYITNYVQHGNSKTFTILAAFVFLLVGHIQFIFIPNNIIYYILGHFLELIAYSLILVNLVRVIKNE
jgi:hypothetical protein